MRLLKWLFQPAYVLLIIVVVALYVNREAVFPEKVAESLEAEALVARISTTTREINKSIFLYIIILLQVKYLNNLAFSR